MHDSFVVAAYTEEEARWTTPGGEIVSGKTYDWVIDKEVDKLIVTCIGIAAEDVMFRQVLCASFNAG